MLLLFFIQLITAAIVFFIDPKRETNRWVAIDLLCCCVWDLSFLIRDDLLPFLRETGIGSLTLQRFLFEAHIALEFAGEMMNPYAGIMFALAYSEVAKPRLKRFLSIILLAPCFYMLAITPSRPDLRIDYSVMVWWVGAYYAAILVLLLVAVVKAQSEQLRANRIMTACVALPPMFGDYFFNHLPRATDINSQAYKVLPIFFGIAFVLFLVFAIRYGVFGVRIHFRRQRLDHTLRALTTGTNLINHAMKNRLVNILFLTDQLEPGMPDAAGLKGIRSEARFLLRMIERIHRQSRDYEMGAVPTDLTVLLQETVESVRGQAEAQRKRLTVRLDPVPWLTADPVHLQELFHNLLLNAMEATERGTGRIEVQCRADGRYAVVAVSDNGSGIGKEELPHIFDPFYSTKRNTDNFGLGLSYCYMVVQKHKGRLEVRSEPGQGTTFTVRLPLQRRSLPVIRGTMPAVATAAATSAAAVPPESSIDD